MFDYHNTPHWRSYLATLDDEGEAGIIDFCEYLCNYIDVLHVLRSQDAALLNNVPPNKSVQSDGGEVLPAHKHLYIDGYCACGASITRAGNANR